MFSKCDKFFNALHGYGEGSDLISTNALFPQDVLVSQIGNFCIGCGKKLTDPNDRWTAIRCDPEDPQFNEIHGPTLRWAHLKCIKAKLCYFTPMS